MNTGKFIGLLVFGLIGVLLCVAFIPMIEDTTSATDTYHNDGYFRMTHYGIDEDVTLTWDVTKPKVVVVNDVEVPINYNVTNGQVTIVADTNFIVRLNNGASATSVSYIGPTGAAHTATISAEFVFSNGDLAVTMVVDSGSVDYTATYENIYVPSLDGPYIMKMYDRPAYVNADSHIFAYGMTRINTSTGVMPAPGVGLEFDGNIDDGITGRVWRYGNFPTTLSNETINSTIESSHVDLYKFESITATATLSETVDEQTVTTDTEVTYNCLLVLYEVTAERTIHADNTLATIINLLPLIAMIGLFMFLVGEFLYTRYL